ncbi:hypothetical protein ACWD48_05320 [Streptomyces sp. NPDC002519]
MELRRARSASIRKVLGTKNMWHVGPSADWPLIVIVIDEAHTYFRDHKGSDPATKRLAAFAAENARLTAGLRLGRSDRHRRLPRRQHQRTSVLETYPGPNAARRAGLAPRP